MKDYNPFGEQSTSKTAIGEQSRKAGVFTTAQGQFPQFSDVKYPATAEGPQENVSDLQKKIEAAKSNGWGAQLGKFVTEYRKKIVLLAVLSVLVVGGLYTYNKSTEGLSPQGGMASIAQTAYTEGDETGSAQSDAGSINFPPHALDIRIAQVPATENNYSTITKIAASGDGVTHLARAAIADYLVETGKSLTDEQKVYAEDYVQNEIGSESLEVGQRLSFPKSLLNEAVAGAEELQNWELENLKQYTENISLL